jgi:hypothetical protein
MPFYIHFLFLFVTKKEASNNENVICSEREIVCLTITAYRRRSGTFVLLLQQRTKSLITSWWKEEIQFYRIFWNTSRTFALKIPPEKLTAYNDVRYFGKKSNRPIVRTANMRRSRILGMILKGR